MDNNTIYTPGEENNLEFRACETVEEVVNSEAFIRVFKVCLNKTKKINPSYYIEIFEKFIGSGDFTIEESIDLMTLLNDSNFQEIYSDYFNNKITFKGNNELLSKFKENISLESIVNYFKGIISLKTINDCTDSVKEQLNGKLDILGIEIIKIGESTFIIHEYVGRGKVLFNNDGKQVTPEGKYYKYFDFDYFRETGLIVAYEIDIDKGKVLLDKDGKQVSPEWKYYNNYYFNYFKETGLIVAEEIGKGKVLLDKGLEQVSPEGKYYEYFNFDYFKETGLIIVTEKNKGKVLFNKDLKQVTLEGKYYENIYYNGSKKQFYYESRFGFKKYIEINKK